MVGGDRKPETDEVFMESAHGPGDGKCFLLRLRVTAFCLVQEPGYADHRVVVSFEDCTNAKFRCVGDERRCFRRGERDQAGPRGDGFDQLSEDRL